MAEIGRKNSHTGVHMPKTNLNQRHRDSTVLTISSWCEENEDGSWSRRTGAHSHRDSTVYGPGNIFATEENEENRSGESIYSAETRLMDLSTDSAVERRQLQEAAFAVSKFAADLP
jgi:hypothetical protein